MSLLKALRAGLVVAGFALGGCQTSPDLDPALSSEPTPDQIAMLSSNELTRIGRRDLQAGYFGKAERYFRTAVEKNAEDSSAWIGLAAAYDNLRRFDLADRAYQEAIRLDGETLTTVNNRGYSYLLRGDKRRALQQFRRAQALDPGNEVVENNVRMLRSGNRPSNATPL